MIRRNSGFRFPAFAKASAGRQVSGFRSGLTLIEVMLAITILGMGLTVLIASASRCLSVVRQAKNYETARHLLGRVEVEKPLQLEEKIEAGSEDGDFTDEPGYQWTRQIEIVGKEEDGLFSVHTSVSWSDSGKKKSEEVMTYLYRPEEKKGGTVVSKP
jgi:prepilin-type N-terminal cleavage/methylation domain-containing protein